MLCQADVMQKVPPFIVTLHLTHALQHGQEYLLPDFQRLRAQSILEVST